MFGTIMADRKTLDKAARERYGMSYCGLCHQLGVQFGSTGSASLTYDMTFLSILLGAVYDLPENHGAQRCAPQPIVKHNYATTAATTYAADMNLFLAYYQSLDDWNDDRNRMARQRCKQMEPYLQPIRLRWPRQCAAIEDGLEALGLMERENELNPDLPTNCFGEILGQVFVWKTDEEAATLYRVGAALGRFVYLLDAVNDLRADLKKQRYNPLVAQTNTDYTPLLTLMMAECTEAFEKLPLHRDQDILQNVLYSGVWQQYRKREQKERDA